MSLLTDFAEKTVSLLTNDGRVIVGKLRGCDQYINCILEHSVERVYSNQGVEFVNLGLYIIRGDNIAVIGEIDPEIDNKIDFKKVKAEPLPPLIV